MEGNLGRREVGMEGVVGILGGEGEEVLDLDRALFLRRRWRVRVLSGSF